jgi:hypothetical protein
MSALGTRAATTVSMNDQQMPDNYLPVLSISPSVLTFGVVSSGFYYNLKFEVKNHETTPVRIKVFVNPLEGEKNNIRVVNLPDIIAPGMVAQIIIELMAEWPGISIFNLKIIQNYDETVYSKLIEANIVTQETFKYVKKSLELQKRPIHEHNVTNLSSIAGFYNETASIATPATTFSEALIMDDEDLEDLLEYPTCSNVYWDPFEKCLRIDPLLGKVIASQDITLEESQTRTAEARYDYSICCCFCLILIFCLDGNETKNSKNKVSSPKIPSIDSRMNECSAPQSNSPIPAITILDRRPVLRVSMAKKQKARRASMPSMNLVFLSRMILTPPRPAKHCPWLLFSR